MYSLPRLRLCTAQQPIATSALLVYLCVVGSTVLYLAVQGEGTDAVPELRAGSSPSNGSTDAGPAAASDAAAAISTASAESSTSSSSN